MTDETSRVDQLAALGLLDEPTRRKLYDHVAGSAEPVSRDEAADAVGVERSVAAYHLDKLVDAGLLAPSFFRPEGRGGPGAGRPAKHYSPADTEITASVPPRHYRLLAEILAEALETATDPTAIPEALESTAASQGHRLAQESATSELLELLEAAGFHPYADGDTIRLRNCPFDRLARHHTDLVCSLNLALLEGVVDELDQQDLQPRLDPAPDSCCVAFNRPREPGADSPPAE